jgi:hypothetical protein
MILKTRTIFLGLIVCISSYSQKNTESDSKCNLETIENLRIHKDSLTDKLIFDYLHSIDKLCENNAEWSEASNWTLFWLADIETKRFISLLKSNRDKIAIAEIVEEFKQPITDDIDLVQIYNKINSLCDKDVIVLDILDSIKLAANRSGLEIK